MRTRTDQPAPGGAPAHTPRWARLPASAAAGWAATLITTAIAALIRLTHLDNVPRLVFDETYYVKDAWSLIELGYEGTWPADYDASFAAGDTSGLSANASYPVHPPTGKWIIGWGMRLLGQSDPVGWRIMGAICGVITVFLLCRLAQNLFRSPAITALAGAFVATDGIAIVMSRTAILDGFLAMFSLAAFLAVVKDQQDARARLGPRLAAWECTGAPRRGWPDLRAYLSPRVPRPGRRVGHGKSARGHCWGHPGGGLADHGAPGGRFRPLFPGAHREWGGGSHGPPAPWRRHAIRCPHRRRPARPFHRGWGHHRRRARLRVVLPAVVDRAGPGLRVLEGPHVAVLVDLSATAG